MGTFPAMPKLHSARRGPLRPTRQGRQFREWRRSHGLSLTAVRARMRSAGTHVPSERTLRNLESGETDEPRFEVQQAVGTVMGCDPNELWSE